MNRARMSTEPASSRYVSDYLHTWYIRLYLPLPLPPPLGSIADRIDSMIDERRFSRKEKIDLENDYQICSSGNWVSDVFPPISAPSVFTLLFVLPRRAFFPCLPLIDSIHTLSVIVIGRFQKWYGELIIKIESG